MQATATTPQQKGRRDKRQQKPKDGPHNTESPKELKTEPPNAQHSISAHSTSVLSQQMNGDMQLRQDYTGEETTPTTPSRPRSMYDSPSIHQKAFKGQQSGNVSAVEGEGQRNKKAQKSQNRQSGSFVINSNLNGTPQPKNRKSQTPGRSSATPSQAYAGPTFHASPAPSSLPMPKFLSRSVPEVNKAAGLSARLENEASEGALSPESMEGSPVCDKAERVRQHVKVESPLDLFFKADQEEKARARQTSLRSSLLEGADGGHLPTAAGAPSGALSPLLDHARHHSRHLTNGSANGLFPMELEDQRSISPATQEKRPIPPMDLKRAISAPSDFITEPEQDAATKRNASSLALKKLLLAPQPRQPVSESKSLPSSEGRKRHIPPIKESSGPFASSQAPPEIRILSRKQPASLPQLQKQFGSTPASGSSPRPRPPSSNLRQELSAPQTPVQSELPELPATPTPSHNSRVFASPSPRSLHNAAQEVPFPSLRPTVSPGVGPPSIQATNDVLRMEEELRRVLKMNVLGSDGATGVRS